MLQFKSTSLGILSFPVCVPNYVLWKYFLIEISFQPKKNILFYFQKAKALKQKKEEGNTAFKAGQLDEAYSLYR